jgi:hypothetical protein
MYTDRFSLPFVSSVAVDAAERLRPGLGPWSDGVREQLRQVFVRELADIKPRFMELFRDEGYWGRVEKAVLEECFPRYCAVAERASRVEAAGYNVWRGGDLLARGAFAVGGLAVGLALVKLPFIPIPQTWDFLILLSMFGAPFLPEVQTWLYQRSHRKACQAIVKDMARAQEVDRMYEPIPEVPPVDLSPVSSEDESAASAEIKGPGSTAQPLKER